MLIDSRHALIAACMMHVEGFYSTESRAFHNCNPGNIEEYDGCPFPSEGPFIKYPTILVGFEGLLNDIQINVGKTISSFIAKYAPPNENNTSLYLQIVCTLSGEKPDNIL